MPASQEQKVDFLLKKIGYSASKTGIAEDESTISSSSNTAKAPFEEGIASPLVIPQSSILADSGYIPTTPPGSDTAYVKRYPVSSALRMTRDSTVGTNTRSYIAYTTYNDTSSARLTNWIDTQFGASYIIKVYKGDPNSGGVELQQAGANNKTDGWFFDYSSGVLNFNGVNLPSGIGATNIYIVGYRYIGATGVRPPAGIGTFEHLHVAGVSTFMGNIDANSDLDVDGQTNLDDVSIAGVTTAIGNITIQNTYPSLFLFDIDHNDDYSIQNQNGVFAVRDETNNENRLTINSSGIATFTNNLNANEDLNVTGNAGIGSLSVSGISTFTGNIDANGIIEGIAGQNKIPSLYANYSDLPSAATYHGMFAHVHATGRGYYAHAGGWFELVNKEVDQRIGTGTETYNVGYLDATNLDVTGITTLGNIGISTGRITGPAITYIDPATVGDDTGLLVVKGNLQVEGTQTVVNSSTMTVTDKNIELAKGAANDAAADGGGITVDSGGGDKTWQWLDATDSWTSSEHIRIPDGKVFGFATDTNTYIGRPAADTIAFTHGGSEKVRITSDGYVGIGLTNPETYFSQSRNLVVSDLTSNCGISIIGQNSNSTHSTLSFGKSNFGSAAATAYIEKNHANTGAWKFHTQVSGTPIEFRSAGDIILRPRSGGETNYHEHFVFKNSGDVGIGSATPTAKLDVIGYTKLQGNLSVSGISTFSSNVIFPDGVSAKFGTDLDGEVKHTGSNLQIQETTGNIQITNYGNDRDVVISTDDGSGGTATYLKADGSTGETILYNYGSEKLATTATGINVTGLTDTDTLNVSGISTFQDDVTFTGITTTTQLEIGTLGQSLVGITTILDEDNMASDSATALATQQSIKAYVDGGASPSSSLAVSADSGSNESINLVTEVLDIEGTANEIETATGTNKVVIGLPNNVTIGNKLTVTGDVGIGASLSVVGLSTFNDDVTITKDKDLIFDRFGTIKTRIRYNDTLVTTQIYNSSDPLEIGYRPAHLMWLTNRVLSTKLGGVNITGDTETDTLNVSGNSTFTGGATFNGSISAGSTTGIDGYYLKSTGIGVTWAVLPSSRTGLTTTATAGQTTFNFSYNIGFVDVFLNGVKLPSSEFTASNGSTIVLDDAAFANDTLEFISLNTVPVSSSGGAQNLTGLADVTISGTPIRGETLQHNGTVFVNDYSPHTTTNSTNDTFIAGFLNTDYRSAEYLMQIRDETASPDRFHLTKLLIIHDGTNVYFNEYGTIFSHSSLATFTVVMNGSNVQVRATPASGNTMVFKYKFTGIKDAP